MRTISAMLWALCGAASLAMTGCVAVQEVSTAATLPDRVADETITGALTSEVAVRIALRNDPMLRASRWRVSESYWRKVQASLPPNPTLAASADPTQWIAKLSVAIIALADVGGSRQRLVDAAQSREEQAAIDVAQREIAIVRDVRALHAEFGAERRIGDLLAQKHAALTQVEEMVRQQREAGAASDIDMAQAAAAAREAGLDQRESVARLAALEARFNRAVGRPLTAPVLLDDTAEQLLPEALVGDAALSNLGLARRPEIAVVLVRLAEHRALLRYSDVAWIPGVSGGPTIGRPGRDEDVVGGGEVVLTLPVFDHGQALRGAERAILESLEEELLDAQAGVILDVHLAVLEQSRARERAVNGLPALSDSAQRLESVLEQARQEGGASVPDVAAAQAKTTELEIRLERARLEHRKAIIALAAALGDRGEEDGAAVEVHAHGHD